MVISINTRQVYAEVDEFLGLINDYNRNKIPEYLREFFNKEKDKNYVKGINPNVPIKEQYLKEETLAIIAWLNLEYWCQDEDEKKRLREIYEKNEENEEKCNAVLQVSFNPDQVFKQEEQQKVNTLSIKKKETKIQKLISKIKNLFLDNRFK